LYDINYDAKQYRKYSVDQRESIEIL